MPRKIKILHLEDLKSDSELINIELIKANIPFENQVVDSKAEFITALQQFTPDIILADHSLNTFNSMEALQIVKDGNLNIPFLLVTSAVSEQLIENMLQGGAKGYVLKDNLEKLPEQIKDALDKVFVEKEGYPETEVILPAAKLYNLRLLEEVGDPDYLVEILSIFLEETPRELKDMQAAAKSGKYGVVSGIAHKLKSSAGLLEATEFSKSLAQVEDTAKLATSPNELIAHVDFANNQYKKIELLLKNHLKTIPH